MIPLSTTTQALSIGRSATLEDVREFAVCRKQCLELYESAKRIAATTDGDERRGFEHIAKDFEEKSRFFSEAVGAYLEQLKN